MGNKKLQAFRYISREETPNKYEVSWSDVALQMYASKLLKMNIQILKNEEWKIP